MSQVKVDVQELAALALLIGRQQRHILALEAQNADYQQGQPAGEGGTGQQMAGTSKAWAG